MLYTAAPIKWIRPGGYSSHNRYVVLAHQTFIYSSLSPNSAMPALEFK